MNVLLQILFWSGLVYLAYVEAGYLLIQFAVQAIDDKPASFKQR